MKQLKMYARRFEILSWFLIFLALISPFRDWFLGSRFLNNTYGLDIECFTLWQRAIMVALSLAQSLFVVYGLIVCIRIARFFQEGEIFTSKTATLFQRLPDVFLYWAVYGTILNAVGRVLVKRFTSTPVTIISGNGLLANCFIYGLLLIFAFLMSKAVTLKKDQDLTI